VADRLQVQESESDEISVTLTRGEWRVILGAARDYDVRVPREQGDGGACLDKIERAL
jgi:hypothetical protein